MSSLLTVINFTFMNRLKSKAFLITTIIFVVILSLLAHLPGIIQTFSSDAPKQIGIVDTNKEISSKLITQFNTKFGEDEQPAIEVVLFNEELEAKAKLKSKEIKGYLIYLAEEESGFPKTVYKSKGSMEFGIKSELTSALQIVKQGMAMEDVGLTTEQLGHLFAPISLETVQVDDSGAVNEGKTESEMVMAYILVYALLMLLYIGVIGYGNLVATEITAEKSSRVMELLISSVSPLIQMFGKIMGICLLGLVQIAIFIATAAVNLSVPYNRELITSMDLNLGDLQLSLLLYFLIFYIMGYLIYATIFAALGSLVSRTEEVAQAIMPVTLLIVAGFMIAMFGLQNPTAPFVVAMSYVPFFTPLIMFLRIGMSDPAWWEVWLSILILAASILALGWLAAKIYRVGVLMYGKRPSFKELFKAMKAFDI